jgi:phosphopantothenoylcysteine decarboxylase/phosphopantothenate--cysteine ligase
LERTEDILTWLKDNAPTAIRIGFAAETNDLDRFATEKLRKKGCDLLVGNDVSQKDAGFEVDTNRAVFYFPNAAARRLELMTKLDLSNLILDEVKVIHQKRG